MSKLFEYLPLSYPELPPKEIFMSSTLCSGDIVAPNRRSEAMLKALRYGQESCETFLNKTITSKDQIDEMLRKEYINRVY